MSNQGFINNNFAFSYDGVNVTNLKTIRIIKAHDDYLFDAAGTTRTVDLWIQPANSRLISVMMRLDAQFAGVSLVDLDVVCGHSGGAANGLLNPSMNLTNNAVGTKYSQVGSFYTAFYEGLSCKTTAAITWRVKATSDGANLDATTQGQVSFYLTYEGM